MSITRKVAYAENELFKQEDQQPSRYSIPRDWSMELKTPKVKYGEDCRSDLCDEGVTFRQPL